MGETHGLDTQMLARLLKERFHDEKLVDVLSVEVKNAVPKGDNYASLVYRIKMKCLTAAGKKKMFSVIVKTELKAESTKEIFKSFPVFRVETRVYTTILPIMEELMEEFGDKRDTLWPKLLGYRPYNMIAFDDLSDKGYIGVERRNSLDFNHSKLVLRNLARLHAMSKVLLERGLITPDDKGKLGIALDDPVIHKWWNILFTVLPDAMKNHWGNEWKELAEKLRSQKNVIVQKVLVLANDFDQRFEVFNHGDPWMCNMLFQYMEYEDNFPISVKFIDYQMCHLNSFIWDIVYFLYTSAVPSVRRSRLEELFEAYQLSLEKNLNMFNYTGYKPTLDDVKSEWKRTQYAHMCYNMFQPLMTADTTTGAFDMEKVTTHQPHEVVEESVYTDGKALKSIGEDLKNMELIGLL
uniref:Ribosomal RNA small subunit methyltransferase G n=1 Tax=Lygus hesperus TaxID=30085 RepID=A0A0A9YN16_LYGHE